MKKVEHVFRVSIILILFSQSAHAFGLGAKLGLINEGSAFHDIIVSKQGWKIIVRVFDFYWVPVFLAWCQIKLSKWKSGHYVLV